MRLLIFVSALLAAASALAAPPQKTLPKEETAPHEERAGETDEGAGIFPPLPVPDAAVHLKDPEVARLAGKILTGEADLRDRRAWHQLSLLYAPFDALPPQGWRADALRAGRSISLEAKRQKLGAKAPGTGSTEAPLAAYAWSSLGPAGYNVGGTDLAQGRASSLWVNPANTNIIFAGFAGGGVWKTTNGGGLWTPLTDFEATTSVGSIDVLVRTDTVNLSDATIYVGLGEGNTASDSIDGAGVLKSTNGGASWTLQTLPWANPDAAASARFRHSIRRLLIDRNVALGNSVWAAGDGGVYHTADGGAIWSLVTALPYTAKPGVGGCWPELATDFVIDTTATPSRLYAAFGARSNASGFAELSCTGIAADTDFRKNNGIYRSVDGGTSWTSITGPGTGFPVVPGRVGRITLMQAPSSKKQIYALISCVNNGETTCSNGQYASLGIYRTSDATLSPVTWTLGATTNFCANQGWYDLAGAVDPTNPAKLFVAGLDAYLSTNSGVSLTRKSDWTGTGTGYVHADQHQVVFASATQVFIACDGGIFKGTMAGGGTTVTWANLNGGGLSTLQFYGLGQHPTTANRLHGGLQDNGEAYTATGGSWSETEGGDGGFSATDWSNGEIAYEEYVYGAIARSTTGGASSWSCIQNFGGCSGCGGCIPDGQTSFIAPVVLDANTASTLYSASKYVYRNTSAPSGSTWTAISPDLVGTPYDYILNVHSAPNGGVAGTIWATTLNGKVWVTRDDGESWTDTTQAPLPNNPILPNRAAPWIATHPADGGQAVVVYSGWNGSGSQPGHVFRTTDGGANWTDISGALPDEPVFAVAVDPARPNDVYIGTEYGVYVNNAGWSGSTWTKINNGQLPHVHINQLEFSRANGKLRAVTHGRGIWELTVSCPSFTPPVLDPPVMSGCGVQLSWTPSGATGPTYDLYRASGACPGGAYVPIATGLAGTTFTDTTASGGQTFSYKVTTAESGGGCESTSSSCQSVAVPSVCPCLTPPTFAGAAHVTAPFGAACSLTLDWAAAAQSCGAQAPVYNIYRSTTAGFNADGSNRIATCVTGTTYVDASGLSSGATYHYIVRAEDSSGAGAGPCRGGIEEANRVRRASSPLGALTAAPFADDAEAAPRLTLEAPAWTPSSFRAHTGTQSYLGSGLSLNLCASATTPLLVPGPLESPSELSFYAWRDNLEDTYDGGIVQISTDDGASWTKLALAPVYPGTFGSDSSSCSNTSDAPAAAGFTGNDIAWQGPYTADLAAYAGQPAKIRFELGTDPGVQSTGWYLDDIAVTNTSQPLACTSQVPVVAEVSSVQVSKSGGDLLVSFEDVAGAGGYNVYDGQLGAWYSHAGSASNACGVATVVESGRRTALLTPGPGDRYVLVTAHTSAEGPSGFATAGEIPPADSTCAP